MTGGLFGVSPNEGRVIAFLIGGPRRANAISRAGIVPQTSIGVVLHRLRMRGFVERGGACHWLLTPKGYAVAAAHCVFETLTEGTKQ